MRHCLIIFLLLVVTDKGIAQRRGFGLSTEIKVDWFQKKCFEKNKVMSMRVYEIADIRDSLNPEWYLKEFNKYDRTGNQIFWRYYSEKYDSTEYLDRHIEYNEKQQAIKQYFRTQDSPDAQKSMSLMGYDSLGRLNYSAEIDDAGQLKVLPLATTEYDKNNNPVKIIHPSERARITSEWFMTHNYSVLTYDASNRLVEYNTFIKNGDEKETLGHKEIYAYHLNDTVRKKTKYTYFSDIGEMRKTQSIEYNLDGLAVNEIYYVLGIKEERIEYTVKRTYDKQNRETETITTDFVAGEVFSTQKEVAEYNSAGLKVKTLVYVSIADIQPKPVLGSIIKYSYTFYP